MAITPDAKAAPSAAAPMTLTHRYSVTIVTVRTPQNHARPDRRQDETARQNAAKPSTDLANTTGSRPPE